MMSEKINAVIDKDYLDAVAKFNVNHNASYSQAIHQERLRAIKTFMKVY